MSTERSIFVAGFDGVLLDEADQAAVRAVNATSPREEGANALAAILLSVAAVEAAVGTWVAMFKENYSIDEATVKHWRSVGPPDVMKDVFRRLHSPVEVGELQWFECFCAIVKLRNQVAHYFPEYREKGTWPKDLEPYIGKVFKPAGDDTMDWTSRLLVGPVAQQVVGCASTAIEEFHKLALQE